MSASALPNVPLGFICGYPMELGGGSGLGTGEMYGGEMFLPSAAKARNGKKEDNPQSQRVAEAVDKWGEVS